MAVAAEHLEAQWQQLCAAYTSNTSTVKQLWQEIEQAYSAKGRHYHNLQHLAQLFSLAHAHRASIEDLDSLLFAIFYHDIVYKALSKTNEEDSASLALTRLKPLGLSPQQLEKISQMILATKTHTAADHADTKLLLDFDLSILAALPEDYLSYTRQIRKEYSLVPYFLYKKGRKKVLRHFLDLPHIYKSPHFLQNYETAARHNLEAELKLLSS